MDKNDLIEYIGNIAKSSKDKNNNIGQFGLGFYSSFLVSDEVKIVCKKRG